MQLYRLNRMGAVSFFDNTTQQFNLQRGQVYRSILLHLTGAPTVTAANNIPANLGRMEAWSLLKNIQIIIGSAVIRSFSGDELSVMNKFLLGNRPKREATFGDGVTANPAFDRYLEIAFWHPRSVNPDATLLDARVISQLILQVQFGTWTDINSAATAWTTTPVLEIFQRYVFAAPDDKQSLQGPYHTWEHAPITTPYAGVTKNAQVQLPVGDIFRGFLINTPVGTPPVDTVGILNEFRWKSGSTVFADITEEGLREQFSLLAGPIDPYGVPALSASTKFNILAWYYYDHAIAGRLSEGIDTLGYASHVLENDLTGQANANLVVHPQIIVPVR